MVSIDEEAVAMTEPEGIPGKTESKASKKAEAAAKKAAKAEKKAVQAGKKAAKAEKKAAKEEKKQAKADKKQAKADAAKPKNGKKDVEPPVIKVTKKAAVFGNPIRNLLVLAIASVLMGVAFLVKPSMVYSYSGYAIGGAIALVGVVYIIIYFAKRAASGVYRSEFAIGLVAVLAGAYVALGGLISSSITSLTWAFLVRLLGVLVVLDGVMKLQYTLDIARMGYKKWWIELIMAVIGIALGVLTVLGIVEKVGGSLVADLGLATSQTVGTAAAAAQGGASGAMGAAATAKTAVSSTSSLSNLMALGLMFCLNALADIGAMIVIAVRNHKANKAVALAEAEAMVAAAAPKEVADFFPEEDTSAEEIVPPVEVPSTEPEAPKAEPKQEAATTPVFVFETTPEPQPEPTAEPAPESDAVFEPDLPDPVPASPADGEES